MHFHCIYPAAQVPVRAWGLHKAEVAKGSGNTSFELSSGFFSPKMNLPQLFGLQHLPNNFCDPCFVSTWPAPSTSVTSVTLLINVATLVFYSRNEAKPSSLLTPHGWWEVTLSPHFCGRYTRPDRN